MQSWHTDCLYVGRLVGKSLFPTKYPTFGFIMNIISLYISLLIFLLFSANLNVFLEYGYSNN